MLQDGHGVSYQDLCDIVRARIEEIVRLIMLELPQTEYEQLVPSGLVFTGGSSNLSGIDALARDHDQPACQNWLTSQSSRNSSILRNPAYATAVGLVLWAAKNDTQPIWQSSRLGFLRIFSVVSRLKSLFDRK